MGQGLQVFDENGNIVLDTNNRVVKILGVHTGRIDITKTHPLLLPNSGLTPFYLVSPALGWNDTNMKVTFSSGGYRVVNSYPADYSKTYTVYVGVY